MDRKYLAGVHSYVVPSKGWNSGYSYIHTVLAEVG